MGHHTSRTLYESSEPAAGPSASIIHHSFASTIAMSADVYVARDGALATVTLHNPSRLNALTVAMWQALERIMRALSDESELRCVVLRGSGTQAFAAGADIAEFARVRNDSDQGRIYHGEYVHGALESIADCTHPTIAMIRGACVGGGLEIACQCDLRIAGDSSRFGVPINRLGFPIAYTELAALLPVIGRRVALELLIEGRIWDAHEAFAKGLLTRIVPDDDLADETRAAAHRIAEGAPLVARWHKRFVRRLAAGPLPLSADEIEDNYAYFATEDYRIGYEAFMQKKKPTFVGR